MSPMLVSVLDNQRESDRLFKQEAEERRRAC
jgi:hypothetical protein